MSLKSICIEVRENLRCINVFLQFKHSLEDSESTLRINVTREELRLLKNDKETRVSLNDHFKINTNSLSGLIVEQHNACFRLGIEENDTKNLNNGKRERQCNTKIAIKNYVPVLKSRLGEDDNPKCVQLVCSNCKFQLICKQEFKRLREFPSGSVDLNELFCHNAPQFVDVLVPQLTDCFYGFQFIVLNKQLFKNETTLQKELQLYCARCLQHLGETILSQRAVKLWTDGLKLQKTHEQQNAYEDIFIMPENLSHTTLLMCKILHDCRMPEEEIGWLSKAIANIKMLLWTCMPDRSRQHLMLHILEHELQVLLHNDGDDSHSALKLKPASSFKVLYKRPTNKEKILLDTWQQDISIHAMQVSPKLYVALLDEFSRNALVLPEVYRYANEEEFELSYIFY